MTKTMNSVGKVLMTFQDSTGHSPPPISGPQGNSKCRSLLHSTRAHEGNHMEEMPWLAYRWDDPSPQGLPPYSCVTVQLLKQFHWKCLVHLLYSLDLLPSDFHLFEPLKKHLRGKHFWCDKVKAEVWWWE